MAGFRKLLVHGCADIDREVVKDVVRSHLDDLLALVAAVRHRLGGG